MLKLRQNEGERESRTGEQTNARRDRESAISNAFLVNLQVETLNSKLGPHCYAHHE